MPLEAVVVTQLVKSGFASEIGCFKFLGVLIVRYDNIFPLRKLVR